MKYSQSVAEEYIRDRDLFDETDTRVFEEFSKIGLEGKSVLDVGCGDGRHIEQMLKLGAEAVTGIDISPTMIKAAQERSLQSEKVLNVLLADAQQIPFKDGLFDIVFSNYVLQHFEDLSFPLAEMHRVLKLGGVCLVFMGAMDVKEGAEDLYGQEIPVLLGSHTPPMRVFDKLMSKQHVEDAFKNAGFHVDVCEDARNTPVRIDPDFERADDIEEHLSLFCLARKE